MEEKDSKIRQDYIAEFPITPDMGKFPKK